MISRTKQVISVGSFSSTPNPQGGEKGWRWSDSLMANDFINHGGVTEPL